MTVDFYLQYPHSIIGCTVSSVMDGVLLQATGYTEIASTHWLRRSKHNLPARHTQVVYG
jgi:hypothetical protein